MPVPRLMREAVFATLAAAAIFFVFVAVLTLLCWTVAA